LNLLKRTMEGSSRLNRENEISARIATLESQSGELETANREAFACFMAYADRMRLNDNLRVVKDILIERPKDAFILAAKKLREKRKSQTCRY